MKDVLIFSIIVLGVFASFEMILRIGDGMKKK